MVTITYHHGLEYWKSNPDLSVPLVYSAMPQSRFGQTLWNLHVNDNRIPAENKDKSYKLTSFLTSFNNNYLKLYDVPQNISVDDSMMLFKG